jgi:hypothetical protein
VALDFNHRSAILSTIQEDTMKIAALICNIALFGFIALVLFTEGPPHATVYIVFSVLTVVIPILNMVVISTIGASDGWRGLSPRVVTPEGAGKTGDRSSSGIVLKLVTLVSNIVLLAFACWAIIDQYPHPEEPGVIEMSVLMILTPILSALVIFFSEPRDGWTRVHEEKVGPART